MQSPDFLLTEAIMRCDSKLVEISVEAALQYFYTGCLHMGNNMQGDGIKGPDIFTIVYT